MSRRFDGFILAAAGAVALLGNALIGEHAWAAKPPPPAAPAPTYADLADLADSAPFTLRAQVRRMVPVEPARASGVRQGYARFYIEARTRTLISGNGLIGEALSYLADLPLDAKGKPPALKKRDVLLFARDPHARPGEIQLVAPDAQLPWDEATEARLRAILGELHAPGAPPRVRGVREALYVPGTLAGEGETQMFLATADESAASITVSHIPGQRPRWGVSFSEVVEAASGPPPRDTLAWYRLACFLPAELPRGANLSPSRSDWLQAETDYRFVRRDLGDCPRIRR